MRYSIALFLFLVAGNVTLASPVTIPAGLSPGDHYRLAFVTSATHNATSTDIATYNTFVSGIANSVPQLAALGTTWTAIASTQTTNARDNTATNPTVSVGAPIYRTDGVLVASSNADLWDSNLNAAISRTELGVDRNSLFPPGFDFFRTLTWTGTDVTGMRHITNDYYLGAPSGGSIAGQWTDPSAPWIVAITDFSTTLKAFYALSGELTVVPEPASIVPGAVAISVFLGIVLRRGKKGGHH